MKAERKSFPRRSRSSVPSPTVRAGHVSIRQKMKTTAAMTINTTKVNATGQENRPDVSDFNIGCSTFGVGCFLHPKKVPPPTPDGREGRLFPPEQSYKSAQLLPELKRCRNKNFYKYAVFPRAHG